VVRSEDRRFEAESGQLLLDFNVRELKKQVVQLIQPARNGNTEQRQIAFDRYLEGCRYEAMPDGLEEAEQAYRGAIELDPQLACAYTNLGNLRYRVGAVDDARALYEKAMDLEPEQPEAHYNLAFLSYEEGQLPEAVELFRRTLELDPEFGEAHFNLAIALSELGQDQDAHQHFSAYLELQPDGPWADLARSRVTP
jgi:Flp pilus assembly protein TadD